MQNVSSVFTVDDNNGSIQYKIFQKNYAALCDTMTDIDDLLKYFVAENIINTDEEEKITHSTVKAEKVRMLLIHIAGPLKAGNEAGFYVMLRIMKSHGHDATQTLSDNIIKDLPDHPKAECSHTIRKDNKKEDSLLINQGKHQLYL